MMSISQIIMLYTLNSYSPVCQLYLSKIGRKKLVFAWLLVAITSPCISVIFTRGGVGSYSWSWLHSSVSFCCSSQRGTICWLINGCPHAFVTFERMKRIRETVIIVSDPGPGSSWLKPVRIKSRNKPKEGDTSLSQLVCLCISYNCVSPSPEVFIQGGCFRETRAL